MTKELKFKIGQMIAAGFPGAYVDEHAKTLMDKYFIGNFFIFARNYENAEQICSLTNELHRMAYEKFGIAPLISIDQEGGAVSRITEGAALFPGAMAQGAAGGKYVYDVEFSTSTHSYEYEIDAEDGRIISFDKELID